MLNNISRANVQALQEAVTATGAGGIFLIEGQCQGITVVLQSTGTTSGGSVSIEEAYYPTTGPTYAGTWSVLSAVNASSFTGGAQSIVHITGSFWAVRVRVSGTITGGGSISAYVWAN